ncbi:MAG: DUF3969 family protein [Caldilineaceae bacterium]
MKKANKMVIQLDNNTEIERLLAILNIGLCVALEQGALSIEAAERYLYTPYTLGKLEQLGISSQLLHIVHLGTELEDVESLLPEKLAESLAEIKQASLDILKILPVNESGQKWVQTKTNTAQVEAPTNGIPIQTQPTKVYATSKS